MEKMITWDGQSRNSFEKSKEGGRVIVCQVKIKRFMHLLSGYQIYNLKDELIFGQPIKR